MAGEYRFGSFAIATGSTVAAWTLMAVIERKQGPLEHGKLDADGLWIPTHDRTVVETPGFGVDRTNDQPYYTPGQVTPGEEALLCLDAQTSLVWVEPHD